jgi:hypothetical protein
MFEVSETKEKTELELSSSSFISKIGNEFKPSLNLKNP